ncbi:hypothetical protein LEP1GSC021_2406 [Leptospira noguchii str. 1993005606]|nr:hypothetical protein LEP1GSC021_2406 [Leptospira noguchii str. 1993005606]
MEKFGRLFSIRKTYFLQVKRLILVGTLEKCVFLSLKRDPRNSASLSKDRHSGERFTEFNFDSKILFNLWVRLWLSKGRIGNSTQRFPELSVSLPELSKTLFTKAF